MRYISLAEREINIINKWMYANVYKKNCTSEHILLEAFPGQQTFRQTFAEMGSGLHGTNGAWACNDLCLPSNVTNTTTNDTCMPNMCHLMWPRTSKPQNHKRKQMTHLLLTHVSVWWPRIRTPKLRKIMTHLLPKYVSFVCPGHLITKSPYMFNCIHA